MARSRAEVRHRIGKGGDNGPVFRLERKHTKTGLQTEGLVGKLIGFGAFILAVLSLGYYRYQVHMQAQVYTPLDNPTMLVENSSSPLVVPTRFWGTYRPGKYFGVKVRSPHSPVMGLMWLPQLTGEMPPPVRHDCSTGDKLARYGWLAHDGVNFGIQEIVDKSFTIRTDFVKRGGGRHGGDWTAQISVNPTVATIPVVSLLFYIALDGQGHIEPIIQKGRLTSVSGYSEELDNFQLQFVTSEKSNTMKYDYLISYAKSLDKLKDIAIGGMKVEAYDKARTMPYFALGGRMVPKDTPSGPNYMIYQLTGTAPLKLEVIFQSESFTTRPSILSGSVFTDLLQQYQLEFDQRFKSVFSLEDKGYSDTEISVAKATLSNMVGGIGYFHGSSLVQSVYNKEPVDYWSASLYTGVPSRSMFPRGFLWDEGFHNLLISQWDAAISQDILAHWMDLINADGWIPREQILGSEARARVPDEFVVQQNINANPPAFFLTIQSLLPDMIRSDKAEVKHYLRNLYPRLTAWYSWYNRTQTGPKSGTYRWRGRDPITNKQLNPLTLTSGLDDYPRASHPTDDEYHVDLRCWMAFASKVMRDIAKALNEPWMEFESTYKILSDNVELDRLHWSEKSEMYTDYGLHTDGVKLQTPKPPMNLQPGQRPPPSDQEKVRLVTGQPKYGLIPSFGYVSLFPFLLQIIEPTSPRLLKILTDIKNPQLLWTSYGLRSLAKNAKLYNRFNTEHDPPYWRGAIWINMNYLTVKALHHYSTTPGPYQTTATEVYQELRQNIVKNIIKEYHRTGYIWEQYDDKTGEGQRGHPFTGWSALFVLIMAEK